MRRRRIAAAGRARHAARQAESTAESPASAGN
jgi:hypothetical protein